jgi:predicted dehydrogenase
MSKDVPRFAVIGTGSMAAAMMPTFDLANVRVTAVVSSNLERGRKFADAFGIPTAASDLGPLLSGGDFDAVYIANASAEHANTAIAALEAGKAVLCEKPLGLSATEAERVAEVAQRTGNLCMEGLWIPFLPAYRRFIELARSKEYGAPTQLTASFGYAASEEIRPRTFAPAAGGVLRDRAIYLATLALDVFGPVKSVSSSLDFTAYGVDRHACVQLSHQNGGHSQLSSSFISLLSNNATLACARGWIALEEPLIGGEIVSTRRALITWPLPQEPTYQMTLEQKIRRGLRRRPLLRRIKGAIPKERREYLTYGGDKYLPQLRHFLALLSTNAKESEIIPLERSLSIQRVLDQARSKTDL